MYEDEISAQPLIEPPTPQRGELRALLRIYRCRFKLTKLGAAARAKKSEVILNIRQMVLVRRSFLRERKARS